jgi:hypothetical protein
MSERYSEKLYSDNEPEKLKPHQTVLIVLAVLTFLGFMIWGGAAKKADDAAWNGERVVQSSCTITNKGTTQMKNGFHFFVESTCGVFRTHDKLWDTVEVGQVYELKSTKGNWAHQQYLLKADLSSNIIK